MSKSIPLSVRISKEDAHFLDKLDVPGSRNTSDKLRWLIAQARQTPVRSNDYHGVIRGVSMMFEDALAAVRTAEMEECNHSEMISMITELIPEISAFIISTCQQEEDNPFIDIEALERGIAERLFRTFERTLRLGITGKAPCYDEQLITRYSKATLELTDMLKDTIARMEEEKKQEREKASGDRPMVGGRYSYLNPTGSDEPL